MTRRTRPGSRFFASALPRVIAHRGLATNFPENTLAAFAAAVAAGASHLETDVHLTRDGEVVVLHDPDLRRVLGDPALQAEAAALTLSELREAATGRLEICTLFELLQTFPSTPVNIDIKSASAAVPAAEVITAAGAIDRVLIASFSGRRRRATLAALGDAATSASAGTLLPALIALRLGAVGAARRILAGVDAVQIPERALGMRLTTPLMIERLHRAGVEVHVWTINDPGDMRRLLDAGVDGIVTDRCDLLVEVVAGR